MCVEARRPHNWKHAELGEIKTFLENEIKNGRYKPLHEM